MIIAQLSDTHIRDGHDEAGIRLQQAVEHVLSLPALPDVVFVTGDCTEHGTATEYARFRELLRPLTMPVYVLPGNHDQRAELQGVFGAQGTQAMADYVQFVVDAGPLRLIGLDTHVPGQDGGLLDEARLQWLEARLQEAPERPTLLFMHHPPFLTGLKAYDDMGLAGAEAFAAIIARHPQVALITAGHVHAAMQRAFHGALAITCPSTMHQLLADYRETERLHVVSDAPACLLHTWHPVAGVLTHTSPIASSARPVGEVYDGQQWLMPPRPVTR
ncbi:phosphodiesterase [Hymenobacter sp. CRA2]|uniref:phosphodiesterase n=1 Tax=Hymenobacter sp. CRA2 TaxID=1955620 RepID=UPI00098F5C2B|nr:phosphodiesterase [Hymenobacter sp. CRA2]OON67964.1 hypothetical protein B0919_14945 [Hymenobacter sp. CRA2]